MATDILIDPDTRDFVDDGSGGWVETNDSRTAVFCQLDSALGEWCGDPTAGSTIGSLLDVGNEDVPPTTPDDLRDSAIKAMNVLSQAGLVTDVSVEIGPSDPPLGLTEIDLRWRDRATSKPADLAYSAYGSNPPA